MPIFWCFNGFSCSHICFWRKVHRVWCWTFTHGAVFANNLQRGSVYEWPNKENVWEGKNAYGSPARFTSELQESCKTLIIWLQTLFKGFLVGIWLSRVYQLCSKQSSLLLKCYCLFSKSQTLGFQFAFSFLKTPNVKNIPVKKVPFSTFYTFIWNLSQSTLPGLENLN